MTTETRQLHGPSEADKERRRAEDAALAALIVAQPLTLAEVETEFIFRLATPARLPVGRKHDRRLELVKVRISRLPGHPDRGKIEIRGFTRTVNMNGRPRLNGFSAWEELPAELLAEFAPQLLVRALTEV